MVTKAEQAKFKVYVGFMGNWGAVCPVCNTQFEAKEINATQAAVINKVLDHISKEHIA